MKEKTIRLPIIADTQDAQKRRDFLKFTGATLVAYGLNAYKDVLITRAARAVGKLSDELISPESISPRPIPVLIPREDDRSKVQASSAERESFFIVPTYKKQNDRAIVTLPSDIILNSEHSDAQITETQFGEAGVAVITSAEGLIEGKQEYCTLFRGEEKDDQLIAVGYEKGFYLYDMKLKEWVSVVTADDKQVLLDSSWEELQQKKPERMLLEEVAVGTETLLSIGYKPWAAMLPSTKMPGDNERKTSLSQFAATVEDIVDPAEKSKEYFFVTRNGDLVDQHHLKAKAGETFDLFTQLYTQLLTDESHPTAKVNYSVGIDESFQFAVERKSIDVETLFDTTFQIMNEITYRMEGITQRYLKENLPLIGKQLSVSGMSPEDMFTNSLGIISMLTLIKRNGWIDKLKAPLLVMDSDEAQYKEVQTQLDALKESLVMQVMRNIAIDYGVRALEQPIESHLPLGISPLIPTKVTVADGEHPTHIDLAGITPNNPDVQYVITRVPTLSVSLEKAAERILGE